MEREGRRNAAYIGCVLAAMLGLYVFINEIDYSHSHPGSQLSGILEAVGLAIVVLAGALAASVSLSFTKGGRREQ